MKFQYANVTKTVKGWNEIYSFGDISRNNLIDLLNEIGRDGWELVGQITNNGIIIKRAY